MRKTDVVLPEYNWLSVNDPIVFIGSCFSVHMAEYTAGVGFQITSNPFGTIFNPYSLAQLILSDPKQWDESIFNVEDKYLSWNANSEVWSTSQSDLYQTLTNNQEVLIKAISSADTLYITFGTAWVYELLRNGNIVSSCHKQDQKLFNKRLMNINEIVSVWKQAIQNIQRINQNIKIVFTVSPVRHKRDGLVENTRSKSRLLESVHSIIEQNDRSYYFPAYEIVIDELRDYSFFERDGVHPNRFCIEEVAARFEQAFYLDDTKKVIEQYKDIKRMASHKHIHPGTLDAAKFDQKREQKINAFLAKYPKFHDLF